MVMPALPGIALAWAVLGFPFYAIIVMAGMYASFATRTHLVTEDRISPPEWPQPVA